MSTKIYYKNIFLYSSLQFMGNVEEYFSKHTEKLVVFVLMPRQQFDASLIRLYKNGLLIEEKKVVLSKNIFLYYFLWYFYYITFLLRYFSKKEKVFVITFHPISLFFMSIQKLVRRIDFVFWTGDYFPPVNSSLILFEKLKRYYNHHVEYSCYLSDLINKKMNGRILNNFNRKTIMWGIDPKNIKHQIMKDHFTVLFVGVIKSSQGLEFLFDFLMSHKNFSVKIIGICTGDLYDKYKTHIKKNGIEKQVFFPNKFFSEKKLEKLSKECQAGIAVYDIDEKSATYYTDPGKVKTYASLGLPIIMSNVSSIAKYVKQFNCGEVINQDEKSLGEALLKIRKNYSDYIKGLQSFNSYFYFEDYYKKAFIFLEEK